VPGESLRMARIVWEARDQEPAFGPHLYGLATEQRLAVGRGGGRMARRPPRIRCGLLQGRQRRRQLDGRRPSGRGATATSSGGDGWSWVAADPAPLSGSLSHQSSLSQGLHGHGFTNARATLEVGAGDYLFAWVYLDPDHPPKEIMLSWNDGESWEHRVYWGANIITYGESGSAGRHRAGALPPPGAGLAQGASKRGRPRGRDR
jgi:hypothetical protein